MTLMTTVTFLILRIVQLYQIKIMPQSRTICISISKRNRKYLQILEDYSHEFDSSKSATIFRILKEYDNLRIRKYETAL
jgi:hypothetical protein